MCTRFADQLTVDEALTAVRLSLVIVSLTDLERILIDAHLISSVLRDLEDTKFGVQVSSKAASP